jgi:hypothetical protein
MDHTVVQRGLRPLGGRFGVFHAQPFDEILTSGEFRGSRNDRAAGEQQGRKQDK